MTHPHLDCLLADLGAPVHRVVFARGLVGQRDAGGGWRLPTCGGSALDTPLATLAALGLRPLDAERAVAPAAERAGPDPVALAARHGLAPLLLVTAGAPGAPETHVVSSAGAVGWRPPLDRLYDDRRLGPRALRLRFLVDAVEHHAARAAECYAASAAQARRVAALFGARELTTLAGQTTPFVELDALLSAVQRTYLGAARLLAAAYPPRPPAPPRGRRADAARGAAAPSGIPAAASFDDLVLGTRRASPELRESLLAGWEAHGTHARAYRRALRARDAQELGRAPVQLARLERDVWAVSIPVAAAPGEGAADDLPRRRVDALERAWALATDAMRAVTLVVYAVTEG